MAHIGTRQVPEQVKDSRSGASTNQIAWLRADYVSAHKTALSTADVLDRTYGPELNKRVHRHARPVNKIEE